MTCKSNSKLSIPLSECRYESERVEDVDFTTQTLNLGLDSETPTRADDEVQRIGHYKTPSSFPLLSLLPESRFTGRRVGGGTEGLWTSIPSLLEMSSGVEKCRSGHWKLNLGVWDGTLTDVVPTTVKNLFSSPRKDISLTTPPSPTLLLYKSRRRCRTLPPILLVVLRCRLVTTPNRMTV